MCRWTAYQGAPIFLEQILSQPSNSLIAQSQEALECKTTTNGDGFGLAWYDARPEPGLYRDVYPAWSDCNLRALAQQVRSGLFLGHVRASTGTATSRNNCHPFAAGRWSFMHNGQVGGFSRFRKKADMAIADTLYDFRRGATDSEAMFLIALGAGLAENPVQAMAYSVGFLEQLSRDHGTGPHMRLSAAFSDGESLYAVRYASDQRAPSLYYRYCTRLQGWVVSSEPLETGQAGWVSLPAGKVARFKGAQIDIDDFAPSLTMTAA